MSKITDGTWDDDADGTTAEVDTSAKNMMADATVYRGDNSNGTADNHWKYGDWRCSRRNY